MADQSPESDFVPEPEIERVAANGNQLVQKITIYPGEGMRITWVRSDFIPTLIDCVGTQKPLYDFVIKEFPHIEDVAGKGLSILSTELGEPFQIGKIGGGESVSIEKELRELGII